MGLHFCPAGIGKNSKIDCPCGCRCMLDFEWSSLGCIGWCKEPSIKVAALVLIKYLIQKRRYPASPGRRQHHLKWAPLAAVTWWGLNIYMQFIFQNIQEPAAVVIKAI
jgi:hypothetical protein